MVFFLELLAVFLVVFFLAVLFDDFLAVFLLAFLPCFLVLIAAWVAATNFSSGTD